MPYAFENAIYATPVGKYTSAVPSKIGYHIFKNMEERKAVGKIKAQQILLAIPPGSDEAGKRKLLPLRIHYTNESWPEIILINWRLPSAMIM